MSVILHRIGCVDDPCSCDVDISTPTPDELPQDKATCHFCGKRNPDQFFMEGFWAHDTCMDAQYDGDKEGTE